MAATARSYTIATVPPAGAGAIPTASRAVARWYVTFGNARASSATTDVAATKQFRRNAAFAGVSAASTAFITHGT